MRKAAVVFLAICFILPCSYALGSEIEAKSEIAKVCVYSNSALITRTANFTLQSGAHKIMFSGIIPEVDENTLRVSGKGNAEVKLFGAKVKREYLQDEPAERVKQIRQEIEKTGDEIKVIENQKRLLSDEKSFLDSIRLFSNRQLPEDLVTKMPATKDLDDLLKFMDVKLKENYAQVLDCEIRARELRNKIDALTRELNNISGPAKKLKRSIEVEAEVLKPGNFNLSISYLVSGANWQPVYDARANFESALVELVSYALVKQNTGEDWADVDIVLSTSNPSVSAKMPEASTWFIKPFEPRIMRQKWGLEKEGKAEFSDKLGEKLLYSASITGEMMPEEEAKEVYASSEEKGVSVIYKLTRKVTVKSDGSEYKLPVSSQTLKADFGYSTYPRLSPFAYLNSRVMNSADLQLLRGRVNVFMEGDFVGSSGIENIAPAEEFDLYLGLDENVKVKRDILESKVDETLIAGIPAPVKKTITKYKISVENYKSKKIKVKLFEVIPVSQDDRIKVKVDKVSLEPAQKDWKDKKGVWLWELDLEPKGKREIFYTLIIECPRQMNLEGL